MRLLALSDIHNNVSVVQRLRAQEQNDFDAVVVAGDLGNEGAAEIMEILASFECPVLYVLGNWDHEIAYDTDFGPHCFHLHHATFPLGGYIFTGFSGVEENWGQNPVALRMEAEVAERHKRIRGEAERLEAEQKSAVEQADDAHANALAALNMRTPDRRRKGYRVKAGQIDAKRWTAIRDAERPLGALRASQEWGAYEEQLFDAYAGVLEPNRTELAKIVRDIGPSHCIVVTHKRLTQASEDLGGVPIFLFGHNHGFSDTKFRGSRFVNVSVLDDEQWLIATGPDAVERNASMRRKLRTYARITIDIDGTISVERCRLAGHAGNNNFVATTDPRSG